MTIDPFVLLAPVLLLAVVALLRFVGCDVLFRLDPVTPVTLVTVTFNNPGPLDALLMGTYTDPNSQGSLDFNYAPPQEWHFKDMGNGARIYVGPGSGSMATGTFTFHNQPPVGRVLHQITVSAESMSGKLTLTDEHGQTFDTPMITAGAPPIPIPIIWTNPMGMPSLTVSVTSTVGWDIFIHEIVYEAPP